MDFHLPESAQAVQEGVRRIAQKYDLDYWGDCQKAVRFPEEVWQDLAQGGWLGLCIPEEYGGAGQGLLEMAVANEELAAWGGGSSASFLYVLTPGFGAMTLTATGPTSRSGTSSPASPPERSRPASPSPSPTPGATPSRSRRSPSATAATSSSTARRCGSPACSGPTG
ncbi:MAG: acyl-CoA dehydrogenase family protein [Acidimicrobiia bacterium]|nr:acyl-CoA dehydrogenase family protein [Acidimicrobiia bacterium]